MDIYEKAEKSQKKAKKDLEDKEDKVIYTSFIETKDLIVEQANATSATLATLGIPIDNKNIYFVFNRENGTTKIADEVKNAGKTYSPIHDKLSEKGAVLLPTNVE